VAGLPRSLRACCAEVIGQRADILEQTLSLPQVAGVGGQLLADGRARSLPSRSSSASVASTIT